MSQNTVSPNENSLAQRVQTINAGVEAIGVGFFGSRAAFALADGAILFEDGEKIIPHPNAAILTAAFTGDALITGADDGRVVLTRASGEILEIADEKGVWIDAVALRHDGAAAWSAGKNVRAREPKRETRSFVAPSSVRGLAFFPKGFRIAAAHYGGVSLWFPNTDAAPDFLSWKGAHLDVTISKDAKFVVTSMQENALHGWRLEDKKNMKMSGYPTKVRSLSWSHNGEWLATSGAEACIIWPFQTKDGPMGRGPREGGVRRYKAARVAFHPQSLILAIGYEDGWILLLRLSDGAEIFVRGGRETKNPIVALAWDATGKRLAFGARDGEAGVLTLPG